MNSKIKSFFMRHGYRVGRTTEEHDLVNLFNDFKVFKSELIRLGNNGDGGYLIPNDLTDIKYCYSPGVSSSVGFELDLLEHGIESFLADFSIENIPILNKKFDFEKKYIGHERGNSNDYITLESWINMKTPNEANLILQMDIEGGE